MRVGSTILFSLIGTLKSVFIKTWEEESRRSVWVWPFEACARNNYNSNGRVRIF